MPASPTQLTLKRCRKRGWVATVVEHWNSFAHIRQDLFGGIDVLVLDDQTGALGIQATSGGGTGTSNAKRRMRKLAQLSTMREWLARDLRLQVWSWKKVGRRWRVTRWAARLDGDQLSWELIEDEAGIAPLAALGPRESTPI